MNSTARPEAAPEVSDMTLAKGNPAADSRAFRRCLGQFATGVTVITADLGQERVGVTANSFSSLSLDPPLVLWSIAKTSRSYGAFSRAQNFAIHVLAEDQIDLSQRFSSSTSDKYEGLNCHAGLASGAPILSGAAAVLECETEALHDGGDHVIIVGRVHAFAHYDRDVLLFVRGRYAAAIEHPQSSIAASKNEVPSSSVVADDKLYMLVFKAFHAMSEAFEHHRNQIGIPFAQSRILIALDRTPGLSSKAISERMYMSLAATEDAIATLNGRGCVESTSDAGVRLTTKGADMRKLLADQEAAFDAAQTKGLSPDDIAATRMVLHAIAERPS